MLRQGNGLGLRSAAWLLKYVKSYLSSSDRRLLDTSQQNLKLDLLETYALPHTLTPTTHIESRKPTYTEAPSTLAELQHNNRKTVCMTVLEANRQELRLARSGKNN